MEDGEREYLRTCEVYNILTEWQFTAGKTLRRTFGSMGVIVICTCLLVTQKNSVLTKN